MLVIAEEDNANATVVAGALNLIGSDALFGRNWGCTYGSAIKNLHFELCYYQVRAHCFHFNLVTLLVQLVASSNSQHNHSPILMSLFGVRSMRQSYMEAPAASSHHAWCFTKRLSIEQLCSP